MSEQTPAELSKGTFNEVVGIEPDLSELADGVIRAELPVAPHLLQPFGIVHGGVYASIAETLASVATWVGVQADDKLAMGQSNNTVFLRPLSDGTIYAEGRVRHQGRTSWIWDVDCTNDEGKLCASSRVTIAVRPRPAD